MRIDLNDHKSQATLPYLLGNYKKLKGLISHFMQ